MFSSPPFAFGEPATEVARFGLDIDGLGRLVKP
jgi:hypothetical protein